MPPARALAASLAGSLALLVAGAPVARAQVATTTAAVVSAADSARLARARQLAGEGDMAAARAVVDSVLAPAPAGSAARAEALWWRATFAAAGEAAESDYRRLITEHARSPRSVDALVRLTQMEMTRGRFAQARAYLARLLDEQPADTVQARAHYWLARVELADGEPGAACDALWKTKAAQATDTALARQASTLHARLPRCVLRVAEVDSATSVAPVGAERTTGAWTVQLAAYDRRSDADAFVARLARAGVQARVSGTARPFRVRVGRYATRADAAAALRDMRQQRVDGFVTTAEPNP
jgi:cell division septation protein DedD